jgi:drug/metabolite transporter superfamily protein YnfA
MDDMPTRFADFLENIATKIRSLTIDRFARGMRLALAGTVAATLALIALIFLIVSVFRAVSVPLTVEGAYAAFGGLFILAGVLVWLKRKPKDGND